MVKGKKMGQINRKLRDEMIPWGKPCLGEKEREYLLKALDSTWISGGEFIDRFESDFASFRGVR